MTAFKQTTPFSGAAVALMHILNFYNPKFKITKKNEFKIWRESVALPTRACSIYGLALYAHKLGLKSKIVVSNVKYSFPLYRFKGYKLIEVEEAAYTSKLLHDETIKAGINVQERNFSFSDIKKQLSVGKKIILRVNEGILIDDRSTSRYVSLFNYKNGKFWVIDPEDGQKKLIKEEKMKEAFTTVTTKLKRDKSMIIFG